MDLGIVGFANFVAQFWLGSARITRCRIIGGGALCGRIRSTTTAASDQPTDLFAYVFEGPEDWETGGGAMSEPSQPS